MIHLGLPKVSGIAGTREHRKRWEVGLFMSHSTTSDSHTHETSVRIAIAGLGLVGLRHSVAMDTVQEARLCAIVDPSPDAQGVAQRRGLPCHATLSDLLEQDPPDGIILATPTRLHVEQAMECVDRGIPVLVEKPLSDDLAAGSALVAAARAAQVPVLVGHHRRHNPLIQKAKAMIEAGQLGEIRAVHATCWFYKPDHYFDEAPWRKQTGAGPISVNLVHDIDLLRHLCGEIVEVQAQACPARRGYENEDVASALLAFENGAIGTISVSDSIVAPWSWEMTAKEYPIYPATGQSAYMIGGSRGSLSIPDNSLWTHGSDRDWWSAISATSHPTETADPLINQIRHFAEVIRKTAAPLVSGDEGLRSLRVVHAIQQAAQTGQKITLNTARDIELSA
jgi:predicted dehydrogenase